MQAAIVAGRRVAAATPPLVPLSPPPPPSLLPEKNASLLSPAITGSARPTHSPGSAGAQLVSEAEKQDRKVAPVSLRADRSDSNADDSAGNSADGSTSGDTGGDADGEQTPHQSAAVRGGGCSDEEERADEASRRNCDRGGWSSEEEEQARGASAVSPQQSTTPATHIAMPPASPARACFSHPGRSPGRSPGRVPTSPPQDQSPTAALRPRRSAAATVAAVASSVTVAGTAVQAPVLIASPLNDWGIGAEGVGAVHKRVSDSSKLEKAVRSFIEVAPTPVDVARMIHG